MNNDKEINYGILGDVSRSINCMIGDCSGSTISRRTTKGFKKVSNINNISDQNAEHIIHAAMIGAPFGLNSKNTNIRACSLLALILLIIFYIKGKNTQEVTSYNYVN